MLHVVDSMKPLEQLVADLERAISRHKFGVLSVHDLRAKMAEKGVSFARECRIFEICKPHQAKKVLEANLEISTALPCRISVYEEGGQTRLATIEPTALIGLNLKAEKKMSSCRDAMKPIEASSCCTPQDTAARAARAIRDSGCGCAPVVENTESLKLIGVVTERDVCCGVAADDRRASDVRVEEIMRPSSACCDAGEPVEEARRKLHEHRATSLPVVDKAGGCCGTVSIHSLERS